MHSNKYKHAYSVGEVNLEKSVEIRANSLFLHMVEARGKSNMLAKW